MGSKEVTVARRQVSGTFSKSYGPCRSTAGPEDLLDRWSTRTGALAGSQKGIKTEDTVASKMNPGESRSTLLPEG